MDKNRYGFFKEITLTGDKVNVDIGGGTPTPYTHEILEFLLTANSEITLPNVNMSNYIDSFLYDGIAYHFDAIIPINLTFDFDNNDPADIRHFRSIDGSLGDINFNQFGGTSQGGGGASTTNLPYWAMDLGASHASFTHMECHFSAFRNAYGSTNFRIEASNDTTTWTTIRDNLSTDVDEGFQNNLGLDNPGWLRWAVDANISTQYRYWRFFIHQGIATNWFVTNEFRFSSRSESYADFESTINSLDMLVVFDINTGEFKIINDSLVDRYILLRKKI